MSNVKSKAKVDTWLNNLKNGNIKSKTMIILNHIDKNPNIDLNAMREQLKIAHQTLSAIISGLMDEGIVKIVGEIKEGDNSYSKFQSVLDREEIENCKKARRQLKFLAWLDSGINDFEGKIPKDIRQQLFYLKKMQEEVDSPYLLPDQSGRINFPD